MASIELPRTLPFSPLVLEFRLLLAVDSLRAPDFWMALPLFFLTMLLLVEFLRDYPLSSMSPKSSLVRVWGASSLWAILVELSEGILYTSCIWELLLLLLAFSREILLILLSLIPRMSSYSSSITSSLAYSFSISLTAFSGEGYWIKLDGSPSSSSGRSKLTLCLAPIKEGGSKLCLLCVVSLMESRIASSSYSSSCSSRLGGRERTGVVGADFSALPWLLIIP